MERKDVHVSIKRVLIDEIDDIRSARVNRTEFINEVLGDWLAGRRNIHLNQGFPVDPGKTDWEAWKAIQTITRANFGALKQSAYAAHD